MQPVCHELPKKSVQVLDVKQPKLSSLANLLFDVFSKQVSAMLIDYRAAIFEIDYQEISAQ